MGELTSNVYVIEAISPKIQEDFSAYKSTGSRNFHSVLTMRSWLKRTITHRRGPVARGLSTAEGSYAHSYPQAIHKSPRVVCRSSSQLVLAFGRSIRSKIAKFCI
jgi:hypothetical protein